MLFKSLNFCFHEILQGALAGSISCLLIMGWIVFGTQMALADGTFKYKALPTTADGCINATTEATTYGIYLTVSLNTLILL